MHTGSWIPSPLMRTRSVSSSTSAKQDHETACKNKRCKSLVKTWSKDLLEGRTRSWEERCSEECDICAEHRRARCCVRLEGNRWTTDVDNISRKFEAAPLINIFNEPKYHASILRARKYAQTKKQILLWLIALDKPTHPDHTALSEEALEAKKAEWLKLHDQKTGGIMGCLPLVKDLPLRLTETKHSEKEKSLIKKDDASSMVGRFMKRTRSGLRHGKEARWC